MIDISDLDRLHLLSAVIDEGPASVVITDLDGVVFHVNRTFETTSGYSSAEAIGKKPSLIASGLTTAATIRDMWSCLTAGRPWRGELCNRRKDGALYWEQMHVARVELTQAACYVGIKLDITERRLLEARLRQASQMETIGTLAGEIAHDFNNILTSVLGFNHLILGDIKDMALVTRHVQQINLAASRAKELVGGLLVFSRDMESPKRPIDLCAVIHEVYQLIRIKAPETLRITLDMPFDRAQVLGTTMQLHQVLMNLCLNGIDAIGDEPGGHIAIVLRRDQGSLTLSIMDSGSGIPVAIRGKIFDPFFTTKQAGHGVGLSLVHSIVTDLGGTIAVESMPGEGARFVIRLPEICVAEEPAISAEKTPRSGEETPGPAKSVHRSLLAVDDDYPTIELLDHFFRRLGYTVRTTRNAAEALAWVASGDRFDVVITDQMMPEVTGLELARAIRAHAPEIKVLMCSGRDDVTDYDEIAALVDGFLMKPLNLAELADTVESLFTEPDGNED